MNWRTVRCGASSCLALMRLVLDFWTDGENVEEVIDQPSMSRVKEAIAALNGASRTMVSLMHNEQCYLHVAGPFNGGYLVNGTLDSRDFFSLKDISADSKEVRCFIGGQDGAYRAEQFVPRQSAERAAECFCKYQDLSPDLEWYSRNGRGPRLERKDVTSREN